jgi:Mg-chelatase subunit ChlD
MKAESILEEVWRIKDDLAREAGGDIHRMCENARKWSAEHPHTGPVARNAEELRRLVAAGRTPLAVREESPPYGTDKP